MNYITNKAPLRIYLLNAIVYHCFKVYGNKKNLNIFLSTNFT